MLTAERAAAVAALKSQHAAAEAEQAQLAAERDALRRERDWLQQSRSFRLGEALRSDPPTGWRARLLSGAVRSLLAQPDDARPAFAPPPRAPAPPEPATPAKPAPINPAVRHAAFDKEFAQFKARTLTGAHSHFVVNYGGTTFIQGIRANRPIRLTQSFARLGVPVLFNFHRWRDVEPIPHYEQNLVFQSPVDLTPRLVKEITAQPLGATRGVLIVSYPHPSVVELIHRANANGWATIYDCRDDWEEFEKVGMAKWYRRSLEEFTLNHCDVTCCVSRPLVAKLRSWNPTRDVRLSPNAYDPDFLAPAYERRPVSPPKIGYFGHLTPQWFAWDDLIEVMNARPNYRFEIIGHGAPADLKLPTNAALLGPKSHPEICAIAAEWSVGVIPFKNGPLADGVDPIKIYEYFGLGLPVVSFQMPQIADYPATRTVTTPAEFAAALDAAVAKPPDRETLAAYVQHNTWDDRARQILAWADEIYARPSVIKTFNPAFTGAARL